MSNILIANLSPAGSVLFSDSESYMTDISDSELQQINGGYFTPFWILSGASTITISLIP
jgi:bacteriocin-like protein